MLRLHRVWLKNMNILSVDCRLILPNVLIAHRFTLCHPSDVQKYILRRWKSRPKDQRNKMGLLARSRHPALSSCPQGPNSRSSTDCGPGGNSEIPDFGILHEMTPPDSAPHWRDAEEIVTWKDWKDSFPGPYLRAGINKAYLSRDDKDMFAFPSSDGAPIKTASSLTHTRSLGLSPILAGWPTWPTIATWFNFLVNLIFNELDIM